jgi:hypothetical protein
MSKQNKRVRTIQKILRACLASRNTAEVVELMRFGEHLRRRDIILLRAWYAQCVPDLQGVA